MQNAHILRKSGKTTIIIKYLFIIYPKNTNIFISFLYKTKMNISAKGN